ncbi:MAG: acyltransferase family protein [Clostridiaceae bacterium]
MKNKSSRTNINNTYIKKSTKSQKLNSTNRLTGADGLRAIACLAVICHHLSQRLMMQAQTASIQKAQSFFLMGNAGVSVFFVLSGFLLSYPFWKQYMTNDTFPSIKNYTIRRATRIIPGYYIALLASSIFIIIYKIPSDYFKTRLLSGLTFTAGFHYITFFPTDLNGALWSINFEVFSYFLMPIFMFGLFKLLGKNRSFFKALLYWLLAIALLFYINNLIHLYLTPSDINKGWQYGNIGGAKYWMPNYNPIGFFLQFSMGIVAAGFTFFFSNIPDKLKTFKHFGGFDIIGTLTLIGSFYLLWILRYTPEFSYSLQGQPYFFPMFTILIAITLSVCPHTLILGKILDNPFFKFTSKISFGLYIWHYFLVFVVSFLWVKDYQYMGMENIKSWALVSFLIVLVSYIIATLSYYFIEKPILNWGHKITKKTDSVIKTAAATTLQ